MWDKLRPFVGKIIGAPVGVFLGVLAAKTGVTEIAGPETQMAVTGGLVYLFSAIFNTLINKKVNPSNAATTKQAVEGKVIEEQGTLLGKGNVNTGEEGGPISPNFNSGVHRGDL